MTTPSGNVFKAVYSPTNSANPRRHRSSSRRSVHGSGIEVLDRAAPLAMFAEQSADQRLRIAGHHPDTASRPQLGECVSPVQAGAAFTSRSYEWPRTDPPTTQGGQGRREQPIHHRR